MIRIFLPLICAALGLAAASCSQSEGPFAPAETPASPHGTAAAAMASPSDNATASDLERRDAAAGATPTESGQAPPAQAAGSAAAGAPQPAAKSPDVPELGPPPTESTTSTPQSAPQSAPQPTPPSALESAPQPTPQSEPATSPDAPMSVPAQRRASTLIGMPVVSGDGSPLGQVKDIIFDRQGQATHVVVAYAEEPPIGPAETSDATTPESGPDGKLTAMPWDAAMASIKDGRLVLDGTKLQQAPSFRPGEWPNLDDRDWSSAADDYWRKVVRANVAAHPGAPIDSTARQRARRARGE